jgi:hypothetical protein
MDTLPLWLQIAGLVVALVSGVAGTVLGIINLVLRVRDTKPRLLVEAHVEPYRDNQKQLAIIVRNNGRVPVMVDDLYFTAAHPAVGERDVRIPETYGDREIPFRLVPSERARFDVMVPFMIVRLHYLDFKGELDVIATVIDGLGNRYEASPFKVDLTDPPPDS